jgi:hypothetical protein
MPALRVHPPVIIAKVRETEAEIKALQDLLDRSFERSGEHLRNAFQQSKRPTAADLVASLPGVFEMHLAVVTRTGAPLVAPVDAILFHGTVWFGLPGTAVRARLIEHDHRVSASYVGDGIALIVHGEARPARPPLLEEFETVTQELYVGMYGEVFLEWQKERQSAPGPPGFTGYIEARVMFATMP